MAGIALWLQSWFARLGFATDEVHLPSVPDEPSFNWCTCAWQIVNNGLGQLILEIELPEFDAGQSRILVTDRSICLELHYRDSEGTGYRLQDYYRRTLPLRYAVVPGVCETSFADGQLMAAMQVADTFPAGSEPRFEVVQ